jgi:hypothetical protein
MPRKIALFVGAVALAASALLTGAVGLALPVALAASYNGPCTGSMPPPDENNYHFYVYRTSLSFDQAQGQTTIGTYLACTSTTAGWGQSMTIIASIQGSTISGDSNLAQCGIGQITGEGTHYWYTPQNNGNWVQFPTPPRLQFGDNVQCAIWSTGSGYWEYALTNLTTNQTVYEQSSRAGYGTTVWWGHEISNDYDLFGGESGVGANSLTYPAYKYVGSSSLWYAAGDSGQSCCGTQRSWMYDGVSHIGTYQYDSINAYSTTHN